MAGSPQPFLPSALTGVAGRVVDSSGTDRALMFKSLGDETGFLLPYVQRQIGQGPYGDKGLLWVESRP
jgi:hypothetical protein